MALFQIVLSVVCCVFAAPIDDADDVKAAKAAFQVNNNHFDHLISSSVALAMMLHAVNSLVVAR
jgi:hypothetical protein